MLLVRVFLGLLGLAWLGFGVALIAGAAGVMGHGH